MSKECHCYSNTAITLDLLTICITILSGCGRLCKARGACPGGHKCHSAVDKCYMTCEEGEYIYMCVCVCVCVCN